MNIDHIAIWANDIEKLRSFYIKYFNCVSNERYENVAKQFCSYFLTFASGSRIELMNRAGISVFKGPDLLGLAHIAINVGTREKVNSLTNKLELDGFTVFGKPRITGDGYYESIILDPENNIVEVISKY